MPNGKSGWDGPVAINILSEPAAWRRFQADLAIAMKQETPMKTGALQNANRIFDLGMGKKLRVSNKMTYALPQHDGAKIQPFSLKGLAGKPKPGGGTYGQAMMFAGAKHPFVSRNGFTITGKLWVPKGLDQVTRTFNIGWAQGPAPKVA